jgi:dienelactone hydrolase
LALRCVVALVSAVLLGPSLLGQAPISRDNPADRERPFNTPGPAARSADAAQFERWRAEIKKALFISDRLPALEAKGSGVIAERVTYTTNFGMRVPAIVYRPEHSSGRLPGFIVVNGHGGDKTAWYSFYTGILYARAGAVVLTYDPVGEDERNTDKRSETREHDRVIAGPHTAERMGGQMITDVMQAVSYLTQRPDVDAKRIAIAGYSMGSFISALAGAVDPRIHAVVLSGGGDLDGNDGYWDSSSKVMCQSGPYRALSFLPDKAAIIFALNQRRGPTFIINGTADTVVDIPHHLEPFFTDLRTRVEALTGSKAGIFETYFVPAASHRPNWVTRPAALCLQGTLNFPNWTAEKINSLGETHVSEWAARNNVYMDKGYIQEDREGGVMALTTNVPNVPREQLNAVPDAIWNAEKDRFVWDAWARHALAADGITGAAAETAMAPPPRAKKP